MLGPFGDTVRCWSVLTKLIWDLHYARAEVFRHDRLKQRLSTSAGQRVEHVSLLIATREVRPRVKY